MGVEVFGETPDGQEVHRVSISGGGLTARVLTWGAAVQDLRLEGHASSLVLGFPDFAPYPAYSPYFGAIAGRYANRIARGRFAIDGVEHQVDRNFLGKHHLHGGALGFAQAVWILEQSSQDSVTLRFRAEDGEMGFPGALTAYCTYAVAEAGRLKVSLQAETDAPTLCNLAHHSYFNLDDGGRSSVLGHSMHIAAEAYLPVDDELIPTGVVAPVAGTDFDFREPRAIGDQAGRPHYDHNFCVAAGRGELRQVVEARGAHSGVGMQVWSTEPGLQFYDGKFVAAEIPDHLSGHDGVRYGAHSGFCLEPQFWPDAPNRTYFPSANLRPGERYEQQTEYRFARVD